jgi:glycosyltransferase involved in cell wall biosynthesis
MPNICVPSFLMTDFEMQVSTMPQNKPTVMQLISNLDIGGAQEVVRTLVAYLATMNCTPIVCTFKDGPLRQEIEALGVPVIVLSGRRHKLLAFPLFILLAEVVRQYQVDIIQTHLLRSLDFLVLTLRWSTGLRKIYWTIHNHNFTLQAHHLHQHKWLLRPKRLTHRLLYLLGALWIDGFIAVSEDVETAILRDIGSVGHKITVINNGVDVQRYGRPVDRAAIRRELNLAGDAQLLIMVGNYKEQKGHRYLIEAMPPLLESYPDLHLILVGDGGIRHELEEQVHADGLSNQIYFLGSRSDVPELLAASDYFVLPSLWEGLPMALIEAMASSLPIVATEVSGSKQVMIPGETGLIVSPGDANELEEALSFLLAETHRAKAMGVAARQRVSAEYSAQKQAEEHLALYNAPIGAVKNLGDQQGARLAYIIGSYPLLTTTFIDREIEALQTQGMPSRILAVRRPHGVLSPDQERLGRNVTYMLPLDVLSFLKGLLGFILRRPITFLGLLWFLLTRPHARSASRIKTGIHFLQGVYAAYLMQSWRVEHIHAHFADRATTMALVASRLLDIPYSFTAHANDIYVNPVMLGDKMAGAKFVATCTGYNERHLTAMANGSSDKIKRIYHGLDTSHYEREERERPHKPLALAVGQLKEKKGFIYLLEACRILRDQGYEFECHIVGEGPQRTMLQTKIFHLGLEEIVYLLGALPHQAVIDAYREATIFVLPAVVSQDGDRDGIPNVILEAQAMELPVVSTRHSGIPEVVKDGINGLLVEPADTAALAQAIAKLLEDSALCVEMGQRGRQIVTEKFDVDRNAQSLLDAILA